MTGRRATDWLKSPAIAGPSGRDQREERSGWDRRANDRRAPRRSIDTLFAASLINQIAPAQDTLARCPYAAARTVRPGIWRVVEA
jgi:hypothetical protein